MSDDERAALYVVDFSVRDDAMRAVYTNNAHATLDRLIEQAGNDWQRFLHDFTSLNFKGNVVQVGTGRKDGRSFCVRIREMTTGAMDAAG